MASIYGFDLTLTKDNTFQASSLDERFDSPYAAEYVYGKTHARDNIKDGFQEHLRQNAARSIAIATFHNNPNFIAGYLASILNKNLAWSSTSMHGSDPHIAIDRFHIEGEEQPVLISYIPQTDEQLAQAIVKLGNKNTQIRYLRDLMISAGLTTREERVHFYDSKKIHIEHAKELSWVEGHWIHPTKPVFSERPLQSKMNKNIRFFENEAASTSSRACVLYQPEKPDTLSVEQEPNQHTEPGRGNNLLEELTPDWLLEERSSGWCNLL